MSLENSVTLDDVFQVVSQKRVPLAPELAGYLTLEIADGADAGAGNVDPKAVFVSEEGSVALIRPKIAPSVGDCEASIRTILTKLLEASGSKTPALSTAATRKPGNGLPALVEELEAALIPVNRSAGRRALARLARETRRVLQGIGRNATGASGQYSSMRPAQEETFAERKTGANVSEITQQPQEPEAPAPSPQKAAPLPPPPRGGAAAPLPPPKRQDRTGPQATVPPPTVAAPAASPHPGLTPPPAPAPAPVLGLAAVTMEGGKPKLFEGDEVDSLLDAFSVPNQNEKQMSRELKAIAGLDPTPGAPDAKSIGALINEATKELSSGGGPKGPTPPKGAPRGTPRIARRESAKPKSPDADSIEALLALSEASGPLAAPLHNPKPVEPSQPPTGLELPPTVGPFQTPGNPITPASPPAPQASSSPQTPLPSLAPPSPVAPFPPPSNTNRERTRKESEKRRPKQTSGGRRKSGSKTGLVMTSLALLALVAGTVAVWKFAPQVFTGRRRPNPQPTATGLIPLPPPRCKVALVLTDVPANAEILLRMGQAPVDVERMPVGTRLELVATAEGYAPKRAVVRAESAWDKGPDGKPRIEVPIQLDPTKAKAGAIDPWPAAEPGSQVGGTGAPGTVHVVSNVRGADVWLLAGLGPEARIEQLKCDGDIDVLLAGPPTLRKRIRVPEKDIEGVQPDAAGNKVLKVSAK